MHASGNAVDLWQLTATSDRIIGNSLLPLHTPANANITTLHAKPLRIPFIAYE